MKLLLDTHVLLRVLTNDSKLSDKARRLIADESNEIFYSVISVWEIEIKHEKHPTRMTIGGEQLAAFAEKSGFFQVGIDVKAVRYLSALERKANVPDHHDPFDRMMICQAAVNGMLFVSEDERIAEYTDPCIYVPD